MRWPPRVCAKPLPWAPSQRPVTMRTKCVVAVRLALADHRLGHPSPPRPTHTSNFSLCPCAHSRTPPAPRFLPRRTSPRTRHRLETRPPSAQTFLRATALPSTSRFASGASERIAARLMLRMTPSVVETSSRRASSFTSRARRTAASAASWRGSTVHVTRAAPAFDPGGHERSLLVARALGAMRGCADVQDCAAEILRSELYSKYVPAYVAIASAGMETSAVKPWLDVKGAIRVAADAARRRIAEMLSKRCRLSATAACRRRRLIARCPAGRLEVPTLHRQCADAAQARNRRLSRIRRRARHPLHGIRSHPKLWTPPQCNTPPSAHRTLKTLARPAATCLEECETASTTTACLTRTNIPPAAGSSQSVLRTMNSLRKCRRTTPPTLLPACRLSRAQLRHYLVLGLLAGLAQDEARQGPLIGRHRQRRCVREDPHCPPTPLSVRRGDGATPLPQKQPPILAGVEPKPHRLARKRSGRRLPPRAPSVSVIVPRSIAMNWTANDFASALPSCTF